MKTEESSTRTPTRTRHQASCAPPDPATPTPTRTRRAKAVLRRIQRRLLDISRTSKHINESSERAHTQTPTRPRKAVLRLIQRRLLNINRSPRKGGVAHAHTDTDTTSGKAMLYPTQRHGLEPGHEFGRSCGSPDPTTCVGHLSNSKKWKRVERASIHTDDAVFRLIQRRFLNINSSPKQNRGVAHANTDTDTTSSKGCAPSDPTTRTRKRTRTRTLP